MARANASAALPSSANETEDADANDAPEASDDASKSESDASSKISSKSSTRRAFSSPSVPRGGKTPRRSTSLRAFVLSLTGRSFVRVDDRFDVFFARSRGVTFHDASPSGLSPCGVRIGLGGSLPLVGAPSASARGDDSSSPPRSPSGAPGGGGEAFAIERGSCVSSESPARDEPVTGDGGPDADLPTGTAEARRELPFFFPAAPLSGDRSSGGVVTTAIAVAVGVSGCASRWRARRDATSPLPPNKGVRGPRKREEGSRALPRASASSSSASLSEVSRRFPPSEGVAPPRARCQLGATARLLCTTGRSGARASERASQSAVERRTRREREGRRDAAPREKKKGRRTKKQDVAGRRSSFASRRRKNGIVAPLAASWLMSPNDACLRLCHTASSSSSIVVAVCASAVPESPAATRTGHTGSRSFQGRSGA